MIFMNIMVAREGIEPPTRGFSAGVKGLQGFINQPLAASCRPLPRLTKAQSWHSQLELVTFPAQTTTDVCWLRRRLVLSAKRGLNITVHKHSCAAKYLR
jgi:hypothetical protein